MNAKFETYKKAQESLPKQYHAIEVFGAGFENVGKNGAISTLALRPPAANEILVRIDALGICLSDIKIIKQGSAHPRLRGRDLASDPTVLGHEVSVTVVGVGDDWRDTFRVGTRHIIQADIYYQGLGYAFGYLIRGGMAEYAYLDERALTGDEGCYLMPVQDDTGYSQAALSEPWACVEMSYCLEERLMPQGDAILIVSDAPEKLQQAYPNATVIPRDPAQVPEASYDSIILQSPTPALVNALRKVLNKDAVLYLLGKPEEEGNVTLDIGGIHYQGHRYFGGGDTLEEVAAANRRNDFLPGGIALIIGGGGPMGQMHVQRALEHVAPPKRVVVNSRQRFRMEHVQQRFAALAQSNGVEMITLALEDLDGQEEMMQKLKDGAPDGYNDIVINAPDVQLVADAVALAADNAFVNVFAGVPVGTEIDLPLSALCRGVKIIGSSGSRIVDLQSVLDKVECGALNTNLSVAAIGGLNAARDGLAAVQKGALQGKAIIYPHIADLPLTPLEEVGKRLPEVAAAMTQEGAWTKKAEEILLEQLL